MKTSRLQRLGLMSLLLVALVGLLPACGGGGGSSSGSGGGNPPPGDPDPDFGLVVFRTHDGELSGSGFGEVLHVPPQSLDGDNVRDFVTNQSDVDNGQALVISGSDGRVLATFNGAHPGDGFGKGLTSAKMANGEMRVIVGAPFADDSGQNGGVIYSYRWDGPFFGAASGSAEWDNFGYSLSTIKDIDGDGSQDIVVGAPRKGWVDRHTGAPASDIGCSYVWSTALIGDEDGYQNSFCGNAADDRFGTSIVGGKDDIFFAGAPRMDGGNSNSGGVWGFKALQPQNVEPLVDIRFEAPTSQDDEQCGTAVDRSPDGNMVAIGCPEYLASSSKGGGRVILTSSTGTYLNGKETHGEMVSGRYGRSVKFSPNGTYMAVGQPGYRDNSGKVNIHRVSDGKLVASYHGENNPGQELGISVNWLSDAIVLVGVWRTDTDEGGPGAGRVLELTFTPSNG